MSLDYGFSRAKLPRGESFPLKRSVLDAVLREAGITRVHAVYYWRRQAGRRVLLADFCGEGRRGWAAAGQASVTIYAVPSEERRETEGLILAEVLPRLVGWLQALETTGNVRRGVDRYSVASVEAGTVSIAAT